MGKAAAAETPLSRHLATGARRRSTPIEAFQLARHTFVAGQRLDMQTLAADLGITRATLFRWVGNRNQLLAEVVWSLAEPTMDRAIANSRGRGGARIAAIAKAYIQAAIDAPFFRAYLAREPEAALRLLTITGSVVQRRTVAKIEELLEEEASRGALTPPLPLPDLAYVITRIAESFIYTDLITGAEPDAQKAAIAIAALLRS